MKPAKLLAAVAAFTMIGAFPALAQESKPAKPEYKQKSEDKAKGEKKADKKSDKIAKVGSAAPEFTLTDTEGKEHKLSQYAGKIVVLEWFNPDCPFVKKHHDKMTTMADLAKANSDVVWLAINSGAAGKQGAGLERNTKAKTDWKMGYPVLLDETGTVGRMYGARTTPHMYVINKDGILAYEGAIDDNNSVDTAGQTNYVAEAIKALKAGTPVATAETKPYGCSVKYGDK